MEQPNGYQNAQQYGSYQGAPLGGTYTLTLFRKKQFTGSAVKYKIFIDGQQAAVLKNGETVSVPVSAGLHRIHVNKYSDVNVEINQNTTAEVDLIGAGNVGLVNISGQSAYTKQANDAIRAGSIEKKTNFLLIGSIVLPVISVILLLVTESKIMGYYWFLVGLVLAVINLRQLKANENSIEAAARKKIMIKTIVALVLYSVFCVLTVIA